MNLNNKGFTLVEVLAVLVILSIIMAIAIPTVSNAYENSKNRSEEIFIDNLNKVIDDYITLNYDELKKNKDDDIVLSPIQKCIIDPTDKNKATCNDVNVYSLGTIKFIDIINDNLISKSEFINPKTKNNCDENSEIEIYQDGDEVYYFKYKLVDCDVTNQSGDYTYSTYPEEKETGE